MKINRKSFMSLVFCFLMIGVMLISSCKTDEPKDESGSAAVSGDVTSEGNGWDETEKKYVTNLPDIDTVFPNKPTEITFLIMNKSSDTATYFSEEIMPDLYSTTDERLNDAVNRRNALIEQNYGVTIQAKAVDNVSQYLKDAIYADSEKFDVAMPYMPGAATLAQEGQLYNLHEFSKYLDLEKAWWDKNATSSLSINNKLYFTTGDISIMQKIVSIAMNFNKKVLDENFPGLDLFELVRNYEWTIDKVYELSKAVTKELDGDGQMTHKDFWGLCGADGDINLMYLASGQKFISKNEADVPILALGQDLASIETAQSLLELMLEKNTWLTCAQDYTNQPGVQDIWQTSLDIFGENRALLRTSAFSAIKKLRNYEDNEYGMLPLPLMYDGQESYYTPCAAYYAFGVVIPTNAPDPEFSAYMLEAISCEAKNILTPAYYETTLKNRDIKDDDSVDMLDNYIFNNVVYDQGYIFDFGGVSTILTGLKSSGVPTIASEMASRKDSIEKAIETAMLKFS